MSKNIQNSNFNQGTQKPYSYLILPSLTILFLLFVKATTGIRSDHFFLVGIVNISYFLSPYTRRLITALGIIIVYWIIYDSMKAWPNYAFHNVDIRPLYEAEKYIFGINQGGIILTPNEYLSNHYSSFADVITGIFYLSWIPLPLIFAFYLFGKNKNIFLRFCLAFFTVNILGFIIYYLHPAAPPWYFAQFGDVLNIHTKSYAAGLLRFDNFFGLHFFEGLYSKGSNVFAAMPSLHASYPLIGLVYAKKLRSKLFIILFTIFMIGIWVSAIYLYHHYILDILAGIACGLTGITILEKVLLKNKYFIRLLKKYEAVITKSL